MILNFWTIANLQRVDATIRKKIMFYAPLVDSLDFAGIDPCTYARAGTTSRAGRDGNTFTVPANVPRFDFSGGIPLGLYTGSSMTLTFNALNALNNSNTVVWFEERVAKSTPTQTNPFDSSGNWTGNNNTHIMHVAKANGVLANSEINALQAALLDVPVQVITPPPPPVSNVGTFVQETPSGSLGGTSFTLSQNPDLNSLLVFAFGAGALKRVSSGPGNLEYTAGGTGNRTLTLGLSPGTSAPFFAQYVTA